MKIPTQIMPLLHPTMPLAPKTFSVTVYHPDRHTTLRQVSVPAGATVLQQEAATRAMLDTAEPWLTAEYNDGLLGQKTLTHP